MSGRDICQDAAEMLQIYAAGETMTDFDLTRMLSVLNDMLDSWSTDELMCFAPGQISFPLVAQKFQYSIGPGGDINITRPIGINAGPGAAYVTDQQANKYYIDVLDLETWNLRTTSQVTSNLPDSLYYDSQYPLGIINVWGTPTQTYQVFLFTPSQLIQFATPDTAFAYPPGYKLAMTTNLAIAAKPYFSKAQIDPIIPLRAAEAKANIQRANIKAVRAVFDPEIISRGVSTYNIRTDNSGRG